MDELLLLKASVLLAATLAAARLMRRAPASARHRLWSLAFAAMLALPILTSALPALYVPVAYPLAGAAPRGRPAADQPSLADNGAERRPGSHARPVDRPTLFPSPSPFDGAQGDPERAKRVEGSKDERTSTVRTANPLSSLSAVLDAPWPNLSTLLLAAWLVGTSAAAAALLVSLLAVGRLARTGEDVDDAAWRSAADAAGARLGLSRPARLVANGAVSTPMAGGIWHPIIFLPPSARAWSAEQRDVVLAHEIAHLAGRDPLRHVVARLAVACYWFHPLAWIAARQATVAREQACDETVLALGTRPSAYARVLLDLAESMHGPAPALAALPMVERSLLETRLMAILNDDTRPTTPRTVALPVIGVALLTLSVAAVQPRLRSAEIATSFGAAGVRSAEVAPGVGAQARSFLASVGAAVSAVQATVDRDSACWWASRDGRSFNGSTSSNSVLGRTVIDEQIGTHGSDRVIQKTFGTVRLCMLAEDAGDIANRDRPSQWPGRARRVVMEARRGNVVQRLEVRAQGGGAQTSWRVGGAERPFDAAAQQWRDRMLAALDLTWELSTLRGEVSSLRGEISSIRGEDSSIRGEISSYRGEVSSMSGRISSVHGEVSSLRGEISSIRGHLSSLHGAISSERGAISSLNGSRYRATDAELGQIAARIQRHEAEIARIERAIRDYNADAKVAAVEKEIQALDADGKVRGIEAEIRAFDLDGKVAAAERRIAALDVSGKIAAIERQIQALDADRRGRQLEERRDSAVKQLEAAIAAIR